MAGTQLTELFYSGDWFKEVDWVPVVSVDLGESYEWDEFHAWYSPSARRYFWASGAGCSCNDFSDGIGGESDFENGDRPALMAAIGRYFDEQYRNHPSERVRALSDANGFNPKEVGK